MPDVQGSCQRSYRPELVVGADVSALVNSRITIAGSSPGRRGVLYIGELDSSDNIEARSRYPP